MIIQDEEKAVLLSLSSYSHIVFASTVPNRAVAGGIKALVSWSLLLLLDQTRRLPYDNPAFEFPAVMGGYSRFRHRRTVKALPANEGK